MSGWSRWERRVAVRTNRHSESDRAAPRGAGTKCCEADDTGAHVVALYFAHCPFR